MSRLSEERLASIRDQWVGQWERDDQEREPPAGYLTIRDLFCHIDALEAELAEAKTRLAIDEPHPFGEGYDAVDLLNDRVKVLEADLTVRLACAQCWR